MESQADSSIEERKGRGVVASCAYYIVACAIVLLAAAEVLPAAGIAADTPLRLLLVLAAIGLPVVAIMAVMRGRHAAEIPPAETRSTSFVERRVLRNMAPINDKRHGGFSEQEQTENYLWIITAETGPLSGLSYGVTDGIVVGRSLESDLALINPQISRRHARFELKDEQLFVEDLDSNLGTVVNGRAITECQSLKAGDEVRFHDIVFRVAHGASLTAEGDD